MDSIHSIHPEQVAKLCKHTLHPSACMRTLWCPQCIITAAQADLERARKRLEAEGGEDASAHMRDSAWNVARLRYAVTKRRVKSIMRRDWQRQERERLWDESHLLYVAQYGHVRSDPETRSPCVVCARLTEQCQRYTEPTVGLTTAWWDRDDALVENEVVMQDRPAPSSKRRRLQRVKTKRPSQLAEMIRSWRLMKTVSDGEKQSWEDRYKLDRAVRQKYDLPDDYELDRELFENPLPAPHARYHHRQIQNGEQAAKRRANRHKRRAEDYRLPRSSLALSELAQDVEMNGTELEQMRSEEEAAELQRAASIVANEVGYLYFVGEMGLLERWKDDFTKSDLDLVQRQTESGMYIGHDEYAEVGEEMEEEEMVEEEMIEV